MTWIVPLSIGLVMGLIMAWPVLAFASSFRLIGFPDLTLEGSLPTGAAVYAVATINGWSMVPAIVAAMIAGAVLGAMTATIHLRFRVNKFLAGIIVVAISYTLDLRLMNSSNVGLIDRPSLFDFTTQLNQLGGNQFQLATIGMLAAMLVIGAMLLLGAINAPVGLRLRVAGSNPDYARALGLSVSAYLVSGLAITNALVAASGALLAMYQGFSDVSMGQGALILALASMTIGERLVPERFFSIPVFVIVSAITGSLVYEVLLAYAIRLGLAATDLKMATAFFVLGVIAFRINKQDDQFLEVLR